MNKETLLEAFYNDKQSAKLLLTHIEDKSPFLVPIPQDPCNLANEGSELKDDFKDNKSQRSSFSKVDISQEKFAEILLHRENKKVFQTLTEKENSLMKIWFYRIDDSNEGPFNALQMDELFWSKVITEGCYIQGPTDCEFVPLRIIIKRFLKKLHTLKSKELTSMSGYLSKNEKTRNTAKTAGLIIERKYRVLSLEVKPNLSFLDEIAEDSELVEIIQTRGRSSTMVQ